MHIRSCMAVDMESPEEMETGEETEKAKEAETPEETETPEAINEINEQEARVKAHQPCSEYSPYDFLRQLTIQGAQRIHEEEHKGSIRAGKEADFVMLDQNPLEQTGRHGTFRLSKKELTDQVLATIQQDVVVYRRK